MELQLTPDEQRYLLAAFYQSPNGWFRPMGVERLDFSSRQTAGMIASLVDAGLLDGQPDCHARLTDRGRREAARLARTEPVSYGDAIASARRRRGMWQFSIACAALAVCLLTLRFFHVI
jgi:hypothetical protein